MSVTADAQLINTTTPELGMTINESSVSELPLNGRDPGTLAWLAPGVINANLGNSYTQSGFSFPNETDANSNGGRQGSTYYLLDGAPNMDTYLGRAAPFPNADATQEFTIVTNNFNAMYGFAPGAVVSIQVKSGTNQVHGGIFEFLRDDAFDAKDWFTHQINPFTRVSSERMQAGRSGRASSSSSATTRERVQLPHRAKTKLTCPPQPC